MAGNHECKENKSRQTKPIHQPKSYYIFFMAWVDYHGQLAFYICRKAIDKKEYKIGSHWCSQFNEILKTIDSGSWTKVILIIAEQIWYCFGWMEWRHYSHYIALFACCPTQMLLHSIAPPLDESKFDSASHVAFISDVLSLFVKNHWIKFLFFVGDNAPVNLRISDLIGAPFIGCASHRFNLACKMYLQPFEVNLQSINSLMGYLRNIKQAGKLRRKTDLEPVKRNVTRCLLNLLC